MSNFPVLDPPRILLHVSIPGQPISWERVGWARGRSYNPNYKAKNTFLWQLKAACPILRPDCVNRLGVKFDFWTGKTDAWDEDIDNFVKFYLDALTPEKPKRRKGQKPWEYERLIAEVMKTAYGPWADDRQIDKLDAEVHRSAPSPKTEILVFEWNQ